MSIDEAALIRLWKEKRGEVEPMDLSDNLIVQLGRATESLNRNWYERNTGRSVTDCQRWVRHELRGKVGDGVNQAAGLISATVSIPSLNFIPLTTFGNWF